MPTLPSHDSIIVFVGAAELFLLGFTLGLFYIGTIDSFLFSKVDSLLAIKIAGGLWGGLIAVFTLVVALWSCCRYALRAEDAPSISKSKLWCNYAVCTSLTLAIKILGAVSGFIAAAGFFAIFSSRAREALNLSMADSVAIVVVAGIVGFLSFAVLPRLALSFTAREHHGDDPRGEQMDDFACQTLVGAMAFSGPISIAVAATTASLLTV